MNTLCHGRLKNNNPKSPIANFVLVTVREYDDYSGGTYIDEVNTAAEFLDSSYKAIDEPFYQVYGERHEYDSNKNTIFLGEFYSLEKAKEFLYNLTGEYPQIISY